MIFGFDWNTQYVARNSVWFWGATSGFPSAELGGDGSIVVGGRQRAGWFRRRG